MPHRSKQEARVRMGVGMGRVLYRSGMSAEEGVEAFRQHLETLQILSEQKNVVADEPASQNAPEYPNRP